MTDAAVVFPGLELVSVCGTGHDFLSIDLQFFRLSVFYFLRLSWPDQFPSYLGGLSLGFQADILCPLACKQVLAWERDVDLS